MFKLTSVHSWVCFLVLGLLPLRGLSQERYLFERINILNGLPSNVIRDITEDSTGLIWIATESGVVKYDGYTCLDIPRLKEGKLEHTPFLNVEKVFCDRKGNVWMGSIENGLLYSGRFSPYLASYDLSWIDSSLNQSSILSIAEDENGWLWFSTLDAKVIGFSPTEKRFIKVHKELIDKQIIDSVAIVSSIKYDVARKRIWMFDQADRLFWINDKGGYDFFKFESLVGKPIAPDRRDFVVDNYGALWLANYGMGLIHFIPETEKWKQYYGAESTFPSNPFIQNIEIDARGFVYISLHQKGIEVLNPATNEFFNIKNINTADDLGFQTPNVIFFSKDRHLWVGDILFGVKVSYFQKNVMRTVKPEVKDESIAFSVLSIIEKNENTLWIGTDGHGLYEYLPQKNEFNKVSLGAIEKLEGSNVVKALFKTDNGNYWLGHWLAGNTSYNSKDGWGNRLIEKETFPAQGQHAWDFCSDLNNHLWVAYLYAGLAEYDEAGKLVNMYLTPEDKSVPVNDILDILSDHNGTIWAATARHGLLRKRANEKEFAQYEQESVDKKQFIPTNFLRCLFEDSQGNLWIGTQGSGLFLFKDETYTRQFKIEDGLIGNDIQCIAENAKGVLFVSSYRGLTEVIAKDGNIVRSVRYSVQDGNILNHKSLFIKNETVFSGGQDGLSYIEPQTNVFEAQGPRIICSNLALKEGFLDDLYLAAQQSFFLEKKITLAEKDAFFGIDLTCESFKSIDQVEYAYRIKTISESWSTLKNGNRRITFSGLAHGTHKLEVKCRTGLSDWGPIEIIRVDITIGFWQSEYFLLLIGTCLFLAIIGILKSGLRQKDAVIKQKSLELEQERLLKDRMNLASQVQSQTAEIIHKTAEVAHKTDLLVDLKGELQELSKKPEADRMSHLRSIARTLEHELVDDAKWDQFKMYFDQANQNFSLKLNKKHPDLTQHDIRMAILIRLNLSSHDIAQLLNISIEGVRKARYRLKKRLHLEKNDELFEYVRFFDVED